MPDLSCKFTQKEETQMIPSINMVTAEGIPLPSACIEIDGYEYLIEESKAKLVTARRTNGQLEETTSDVDAEGPEISTITFDAKVWFNQSVKTQGKPALELKDKEGKAEITIDFAEHQSMQDYWQRFSEGATNNQKVEGTCEFYIKTVLIPSLR